jgi:GPH family glycoside/pentoside/hexuronide:cation symporter
MNRTPASDRLPWKSKVSYGVGDLGFSITGTLIGAFFLLFLTDVVGLRPALAGLTIGIASQWDWINDPIVGHLSDRTRSRWGRRRPFLLFGFIPFGILFTLLWLKVPIASSQQGLIAIYYAAMLMIYDTVATLSYMPYYALTPELTGDYDERTSLTAYRMAFSILGGLIAYVVPTLIIGSFKPENARLVLINGGLFAVISALPLLITFLGTRERPVVEQSVQPGIRDSLLAALKNPPFLFSVGIYLFTWTAMGIVASTMLYFIKYYIHREAITSAIFAAIFVTALLFLPFWTWLSGKSDKRLAYIFGIAFWAICQVILVLMPPSTSTVLIIGLCCFAGIGISAAHVLPWAIIPDAVEWDELHTGQRHEGMFYSLVMLAQKASSGLAFFLIGALLEWSGYVANTPIQTHTTLLTIRAITGGFPAFLLICGIIFASIYPIGRAAHLQIRTQLEARKAQQESIESESK